jgi:putative spermidine/putrescine transport system permease protein
VDRRRDCAVHRRYDRHRPAGRHPVPLQPQSVHAGEGDGRCRHARELRQATDPFYRAILFRTIRVAALCTVICVVLAFLMAYCSRAPDRASRIWLLMAVILPLFVGNAVRAAGWMVLLGNRGFINSMLIGLGIAREPWQIMYTEFAVVVASSR